MDTKQERYDQLYMNLAVEIGNMSYAEKLKVGSLAVKNGNILSMGFNGTPSGWDNDCEYRDFNPDGSYNLKTKEEVIHSEANMVCKAARDGVSLKDATAYVTIAPCAHCALLMLQSGITKVIFKDFYKTNAGINILKQSNVEVKQINGNI
jgi:dCMP deaminase